MPDSQSSLPSTQTNGGDPSVHPPLSWEGPIQPEGDPKSQGKDIKRQTQQTMSEGGKRWGWVTGQVK